MISRWEPFRDMMTLREAMDRLFEDSFVRPGPRWAEEGTCALPIDAYTTADDVVIIAAVPGVEPNDIEVTIDGDTLTIKGEFKGPLENVDYVVRERTCGKFSRTVRLNVPVEAGKAEATFDKGVMTLVIPKSEEVKPRTIKVVAK
jgi:HSP20 family protein